MRYLPIILLSFCLFLLTLRSSLAQETEPQPITAGNAAHVQQIARLGRGTANDLEWDPSGTLLAVGSATGVWLLNEQLDVIEQTPITQEITDLAWSWDGRHLAVTTSTPYFCGTQIWSADFSQLRFDSDLCGNSVQWSTDNVHTAIFNNSPDANEVQVIDVENGTAITLPGQNGAWSPTGKVLFTRLLTTRSYSGTPILYSWDATTWEQLYALDLSNADWFPILWAQDDRTLILGCGESIDEGEGVLIRLCGHDAREGTIQPLNEIGRYSIYGTCVCVFDLQANYDQSQFAFIGNIPSAGYLNLVIVKDENNLRFSTEGNRFTWKPRINHLTVSVGNGFIRSYDVETGELIAENLTFTDSIHDISIRPNTSEIASAAFGYEQNTAIWSVFGSTTEPVRYMMGQLSEIAHFTPDGSILIAGGTVAGETVINQDIIALNPVTGEYIRDIAGFYSQWTSPPSRFWNADYSQIAEILDSGDVLLPNGRVIKQAPMRIMEYAAWSFDGMQLAAVERIQDDYTFEIRTWNASNGSLINTYRSGMFRFRGLVWSPDGSQIAVMHEHPTGSDIYVRGLRVFSVIQGHEYVFDQNDFEVGQAVNVERVSQQAKAAWNSAGSLLAVVLPGEPTNLQIYQVGQPDPLISFPIPQMADIEWSFDDRFIAAGSEDGTIWVWGVSS